MSVINKMDGMRKVREKLIGFPGYLKDWITTFKGGLTLFCLLILFGFPLLTQSEYFLDILILAMIFSIFAASWDFLAGFTGLVSFGHAIFFGISAYYVSASLVFNNFSWWAALIVGVFIAVSVGFIIGIITLRMKGPYLALGTMTIGLMLMNLYRIGPFEKFFWGDMGIGDVPALSKNILEVYYITLIFMIFSIIIMIQITKTDMGTIFKSIRDDEIGSGASGINTTKYKVIAFMISSLFAGLAGGFFAMYNRSVNPLIFQPYYSFIVLIMTAIGGIATISGSALGAFIFVILTEALRDLKELPEALASNVFIDAFSHPAFVFSILLIFMIRFLSDGILTKGLEKLKDLWDVVLGR